MRIILNSDVLYTKRLLATGLPAHLDRFCRDAAGAGAALVLPRTALLEGERHQQELAEQEIAAINNAVIALERWRVEVPAVDAERLVTSGNLVDMLRDTGIQVEVEEPLLDDYREAERRACLHLLPQPPKAQADEMRDLVIWAVALRLARRDGKAILVSRDEIHSHERGEPEARAHGLLRAKNLDEALDLLGRESPAGALASSMLATVWNDLRAANLPLPETPVSPKITNVAFVTDGEGRVGGTFAFSLGGPEGPVSGIATVQQVTSDQIRVGLTDLKLGPRQWRSGEATVLSKGELPRRDQVATNERLDALKALLGDPQ